MRNQVYPVFPEPVVEFNEVGIDQKKVHELYENQEWLATNPDDNGEYFLDTSSNLKVLDDDRNLKRAFEKLVNEYTTQVMLYENEFLVTTSWFTRTEKNKISTIHNHGNAVICAVYYFGVAKDEKSKIVFEKPFLSQFDIKPRSYNIFNGVSHTFEMGNDSLLVFPSHLKHKVVRHQSESTRKSLAMNFMPRGRIGAGATEIYLCDPAIQ